MVGHLQKAKFLLENICLSVSDMESIWLVIFSLVYFRQAQEASGFGRGLKSGIDSRNGNISFF